MSSFRRLGGMPSSGVLRVTGPVAEALVHEPRQHALVPGVEEVGVCGEDAAGGEEDAAPLRERIADLQADQRDLDRMGGGADVVPAVGHVAPVIRAVEVLAVPAVGEVDVQLEEALLVRLARQRLERALRAPLEERM